LLLAVYLDDDTNTGIPFRSRTRPVSTGPKWEQTAGRVFGPQVEIRRNLGPGSPTTGMFYGEALGTGWLSDAEKIKAGHNFYHPEDWNLLQIVTRGPRMQSWVNGHLIDDITRDDVYATHPTGFIGLQVHGIKNKGPFVMKFRKIKIRKFNEPRVTPASSHRASRRGIPMKRRHFIQAAAAATVLASSQPMVLASDDATKPTRVIDTHTHFYDPTRPQGVPWPPKESTLYRKVLPADFLAVAGHLGIRETVVVEASEWVEDNQWVLDLAETNPSIVGVVGNLNPRAPDFNSHLDRFSKRPLFRGLRWRSNPATLDHDLDTVVAAAKKLADLDLELDLAGACTTLPSVNRLAQAVPNLRIVINHVAHGGDPKSLHPKWKATVAEIAKQPNVFMKVSGLAEQVRGEAGKSPTDTEYYLPVLDHLWDHFGEDRLIYGSNWPVSDRGASYDDVYKIVHEYFSGKGNQVAEKYFWKNSLVAYRWKER
jgi:predicted TIM-barrel fold metal-dependent hydrolase